MLLININKPNVLLISLKRLIEHGYLLSLYMYIIQQNKIVLHIYTSLIITVIIYIYYYNKKII